MIYIKSPWIDPYLNLALEEYLLTDFGEEVFMLWRNDKSVIVGKNQNSLAEINADYVRENGIAVVRRLTGGGAVFHDLGNLNFSFIVNNEEGFFSDFRKFTTPIVETLHSYGVNACFGGRNDILVDGKKISGNSQAVFKGKLLHHGTILFHTDFGDLAGALNPDPAKISGKGISSVKSRVTNIWKHKKIDIEEFTERLAVGEQYTLNAEDERHAKRLAEEKYRTWEWNFGYSPKYGFHNRKRFAGGALEAFLNVDGGDISDIKIFGDFFSRLPVEEIETVLRGVKHRREDVSGVLAAFDINEYFFGITVDEVLECLGI